MLELQEITIDKKDLFNKYLKKFCRENSEFTFTNLFMWRKSYDIRYVIINGGLCLMPRHASGPRSATFPVGTDDDKEIETIINTLLDYFNETNQTALIRLYDEKAVEVLTRIFPDKFIITEDINSFDYVYSVEQLISLSGKKFHAKRNHVNKFKSMYNYEYRRIDKHNLQECKELYDNWYAGKTEEFFDLNEGKEAFYEFVDNFESLDSAGGAIYVDGKMVAFSFGEPLCKNMAVIHFEYADTEYQGSFPMINQQFLEHEWSRYEFVNREEDMGIEGMRKAKHSYRPVKMTKKYVATVK